MSIFIGNKNNKKIFSINTETNDTHETPNNTTVFHSSLPYLEVEVYDVPREPDIYTNTLTGGAYNKVAVYDFGKLNPEPGKATLVVVDGRILQPYYCVATAGMDNRLYPVNNHSYKGAFNPLGTMEQGRGEVYSHAVPFDVTMTQAASLIPDYAAGKLYIPEAFNSGNAGLWTQPGIKRVQLIVFKNINSDSDKGYIYQPVNPTQNEEILVNNKVLMVGGEDLVHKKFLSVLPDKTHVSNSDIGKDVASSSAVATAVHSNLIGTHYHVTSNLRSQRYRLATAREANDIHLGDTYKGYAINTHRWFRLDNNILNKEYIYCRGSNRRYCTTPPDTIQAPLFRILQGASAGSGVKFESTNNQLLVADVPLFTPNQRIMRRVADPIKVSIPATSVALPYSMYKGVTDSPLGDATLKSILVRKTPEGQMPLMYSITSPYGTVPKRSGMEFSRIFSSGTRGVHSGLMNPVIGGKSIFYSSSLGAYNRGFRWSKYTKYDDETSVFGCLYIERRAGNATHDYIDIKYSANVYKDFGFNANVNVKFSGTAYLDFPAFILDIMPLL